MERPRSGNIHERESGETGEKHREQLEIMVTHEAEYRQIGHMVVLHHKAVAAEKKEYRHAVMAEIRKQMHRQQSIGIGEYLDKSLVIGHTI